MDGKPLEIATSHPYLGSHMSADLSWNSHCDELCSKANKTLGVVQRALSPCSPQVKERAYTALVRPGVEYASAAWNPHTEKNITQLENIQRRAARFVCGDYRRTSSVSAMIDTLGWQSLEHRRLLNQATMMFKIQTGKVDIQFPPIVQPAFGTTTRSSHQLKFQHLQCNILIYKYSLFPRLIPIWNQLPSAALSATDTATFQMLASPVIMTLKPTPPLRRL
jgi:hypothetical protein